MKYQIIQYVRKHPGARRREIASGIHVWQCDREFLKAMSQLIEAGILIEKNYKDPAQMEDYLTYTVKERR